MSAAAILVLCAQALIAQVAFSQCVYPGANQLRAVGAGYSSCGALGGNGLAYGAGLGIGSGCGIGAGLGYAGAGINAASIEVTPTSGGALPVSSASAIAPTGLSVESENAYEGSLLVVGELPFLSAVALEGALPSAGAGIVNYGCGNGVTAITSNALNSAGAIGVEPAGIGYGAAGYGAAGYGAAGYGAAGYGAAGCGSGIAAVAPAVIGLGSAACGCGGY
ncbi:chorion class B protein Ld34-like [Anticarsia gemmatalis]|uniref:chorion class B protein Ld34-like n=1 Tax=Anticarsia gemmatalis TaxID=129554 RepID=UPI003F761508